MLEKSIDCDIIQGKWLKDEILYAAWLGQRTWKQAGDGRTLSQTQLPSHRTRQGHHTFETTCTKVHQEQAHGKKARHRLLRN